jgi:hypothetical protein
MRKLTLKNADAFHDPENFPDVVFLIDKDNEENCVAYMRRGVPTMVLNLDGSPLRLLPRKRGKKTRMVHVVGVVLHPRRADLTLAVAAA